ncbi:MAG: STAS domain-containing protein [Muribaculaceae bacterium]|jgi:anti-anti-sigma factor|nr:STAS domain-containing protein [Muribaculaceae bacterium]
MEIAIINENGNLTVVLKGRLDTLQAAECDKQLAPIHENADKDIVIECGELEYISSSGLRIFLSILKDVKAKGGSLVLKHVSSEIRNIFTITGFHKLFTIQD